MCSWNRKGVTEEELQRMLLESDSDDDTPSGNDMELDDSEDDPDYVVQNNSSSESSDNVIDVPTTSGWQISFTHSISDSESTDTEDNTNNISMWGPVSGSRLTFQVVPTTCGINPSLAANLVGKDPYEFFCYFFSEDLINVLVVETNRYAAQKKRLKLSSAGPNARIRKWTDTNANEIKQFFGIVIWMGLVHMPTVASYWSKKILYANQVSSVMSRNRCELLLSMIHCSDNEHRDPEDRLYKISNILQMLLVRFQEAYTPESDVCIAESNVPWRGRLSFRQYIPNKRHRYGIKLFKLCVAGGYTWSIKIYCGKEKSSDACVSENVVMNLMDKLLDSGRTLYCDNWYSSVTLAKKLVDRKTHLVGTLRSNRKGNPQAVICKKLKKGESFAQQNNDKIVVLKWKDKRDVLMISTKHDDKLDTRNKKGKDVSKPEMIFHYNDSKGFIDLSDQMSAYSPCIRRTVKWYQRILFHLITATCVTNAAHLYRNLNHKTIKITTFKECIATNLLQCNQNIPVPMAAIRTQQSDDGTAAAHDVPPPSSKRHILKELKGPKKTVRKRCIDCYKNVSAAQGRKVAQNTARRVHTYCEKCNVFLCIPCFEKHSKKA